MRYPWIVIAFLSLEIFIVVVALYLEGFSVNALQTTTRFSGRLSLLVFSIIFLSSIGEDKLSHKLLIKPYHLFAIVHGIHLLQLLAFIYLAHQSLDPVRASGGIIAYIIVFVMPVVSDYNALGKISTRRYQIVQKIFQYYIWFVFFMTYLPRVMGKAPAVGGFYWEHVALLGWVSTMLGLKITQQLLKPTRSSRRQ